jgi:hypothetical protein
MTLVAPKGVGRRSPDWDEIEKCSQKKRLPESVTGSRY